MSKITKGHVKGRVAEIALSAQRWPMLWLAVGMLLLPMFFSSPAYTATAANSAQSASVEGVRLWRAPDHTRLVFDLSNAVEHEAFPLDKPDRVVIDIASTQFAATTETLDFSNTPIRKLRTATRNEDSVRIVLDLTAGIKLSSFTLPENEQYGHRLVVDLYDLETATSAASDTLPESSGTTGTAATSRERSIGDVMAQDRARNIVIAIDAGHGGDDPGAIGPKRIREKNVVFAISKQLEKIIDGVPGFDGMLVRTGDYYVPLKKRASIARKQRADLMISVHADAFRLASARGASVYALSQRGATSENARYLADRENRADLIGGSGGVSLNDKDEMLAQVILDLSMTATLTTSLQVGDEVLKSIGGIARLHKRKVEQAGFVVLKSPDIPSILVETGFISNPDEARKLNQSAYRKKMAKAIFAGVRRYFEANPPDGTLLALQLQQQQRGNGTVHVIAHGDTLSDIAQRYRVSVAALKQFNGLSSTAIRVGQKLKIPLSS